VTTKQINETIKKTNSMNRYLLYLILLSLGLVVAAYMDFNNMKDTQSKMVEVLGNRFRSYDFQYFATHNYILPNKTKTRGKLCLDTSNKTTFYKGKIKTSFYYFMDTLDCNKKRGKENV